MNNVSIKITILITSLFFSVSLFSQQNKKPNIILIMADDVSWNCFGAYDAEDYSLTEPTGVMHQGFYGDIDAGPTREYLIANKDDASTKYYFDLSVAKHPEKELYNIKEDPYQLNNLAAKSEHADLCTSLQTELFAYLKETKDPRMEGLSPWDNYPYNLKKMDYNKKHLKPIGQRDGE